MSKKQTIPKWDKEAIMAKHDFNYIREHFYDPPCTLDQVRSDILEVYNDNLDLTQLSAEGKNTVRITNYFVMKTQSKATSIRAKMSPHNAINNDDALCEIFNRIDTHPRFFDIRASVEENLLSKGYGAYLPYNEETKLGIKDEEFNTMSEIQQKAILDMRKSYQDQLNLADLREVRRAVAHMPSFHRVSQFPNHVAQRIYEKYAPIKGGIILDSSSGWGNRMMAALCSKYGYKYLGTDPNSEMHPNYRALANILYETIYESSVYGEGRKFPEDFIDIRDQGSEFDVPEWHGLSGYTIESNDNVIKLTNDFTNKETLLPTTLNVPKQEAWNIKHPLANGKGCCDTGTLPTTGAKLEPIWNTHDKEVFNSGIGDLSFTSPPYFFLECYTEDSQKGDLSTGQSAGKGAKYTDWLTNFVYPTVVNHFNYLKPGAYYIYNLKDLPKEDLYLYSDWLSICLDVGFELLEEPEMILKSRRQFGKKDDGSDLINFKGATECIGVLRKPLNPGDETIHSGDDPELPKSTNTIFHIQHSFVYPLIKKCRPEKFETKLPQFVIDYLEDKYKDKRVQKRFKS